MKIGVYVGSFNPPHYGHINGAKYLIDNGYVDKVLLLPAPNYWDKQNLVSMQHRLNMLKFYENENIIVDNIHNNYPYTYEVIEALEKDYPRDELYLIIGADNLEKFHLWKRLNIIFKHHVIVLNREDINIDNYLEQFDKSRFIIVKGYKLDVSSTIIRIYLNENVRKYIINNNLYKEKE